MTVNARYILTITVSGTAEAKNAFGTTAPNQIITPDRETLSLNTKGGGSASGSDGSVVQCYATGGLEAEILGLVKR